MGRWLITFMLVFLTTPVLASKTAILKKTTTSTSDDAFVTELHFDKPVEVSQDNLEFINQTVQLNIKDASVFKGKEFTEVEDDRVKSVYVYQFDKKTMRARIIHHDTVEADKLDGFVTVASKKNVVRITVKKPQVAKSELPVVPPADLNSELDRALSMAEEAVGQEDSVSVLAQEMSTQAKFKKPDQPKDHESKAINLAEEKNQDIPKESEIPVLVGAKKEEKSAENPYFRMIISLVIVVVIGLGTVIFTKKWARKSDKDNKHGKIKVLTQHHLGPKKSLAIVRVAGESILIGITDQNISMLKSLSLLDEDLPNDLPGRFDDVLDEAEDEVSEEPAVHRSISSQAKIQAKPAIDDEEFSMGRIKDMVSSKLKEMRTL